LVINSSLLRKLRNVSPYTTFNLIAVCDLSEQSESESESETTLPQTIYEPRQLNKPYQNISTVTRYNTNKTLRRQHLSLDNSIYAPSKHHSIYNFQRNAQGSETIVQVNQ
jgi:hypothetical protein